MKSINRGILFLLVITACLTLIVYNVSAQVYGWSPLGNHLNNGVDGNIYAITYYQNKIIVAGQFTHAGGASANNIAQWDGTNWSPLGNGFNDAVYSLKVWNGNLYAGGHFTASGSNNLNYIARWNGSSWLQVGILTNGVDNDVRSIAIDKEGNLIVGGRFTFIGSQNYYRIARWTGLLWQPLGSQNQNGLNDDVYAIIVDTVPNPGHILAGGKFTQTMAASLPASHIAYYDESSWNALGSGVNNNVYALTYYNNELYAGGIFTTADNNPALYIAHWNGAGWAPITQQVDSAVYSLNSVNGKLIAGGSFKFAGNSVFGSRIAQWNGTSWSRMITGTNNIVNVLFVKDTLLYAGGNFITAGGDWSYHVGLWGTVETHTVSGQARYANNNLPVDTGKVLAVRMDVLTREVIVVDSTQISRGNNGMYTLSRVPRGDSLYILIFPSDEYQDNFVPTYHTSTIDWRLAVKIFPENNLTNIDIVVIPVLPQPQTHLNANISGYVYLNISPPMYNPLPEYPYLSGAILYAQQNGVYKKFAVSGNNEHYSMVSLPAGNYDITVYRIGYTNGFKTVALNSTNLDTINFYLDTVSLIGVQNISKEVPESFSLSQNYPNPFNPATTIKFAVQKTSNVKLTIFNVLGQEVSVLVNELIQPGEYKVIFDAFNLPSGIYFYKLDAGLFSETRKMILLK